VLAGLILLVAAAQAASAGPSAASGTLGPTDVEIAIASPSPGAAAAVREDLEDLLARRGLVARYRTLAAIDRDEVLRPARVALCALACIWIDLGVAKGDRAFVYISATVSEQVVIRQLPLPSGVDEVAREEVSHIVATSVEALQAGRPLPIATSKADVAVTRTSPAPRPAPAATPQSLWLAAGVGAGVAHEGAAQLALPMAAFSLVVAAESRRLAPALWLTVDAFSSDASGDAVALRFLGGELVALGAIGTRPTNPRARHVAARFGLGPGFEVRETVPTAASGATSVAVDAARVDPGVFVRAAARLEVGLFGAVGLFVAAACDARVLSHRYTVDHAGTTEALFQPDFLRPSLVVGLDARLAGEDAP
jgi:hypothetical protein